MGLLRAALVALLLLPPSAAGARAETLAVGSDLAPFSLEDQHGRTREVDASVRLLVFGRDMKAGDVIRDEALRAALGLPGSPGRSR
jgi:hypothetical protein